MRTRAFLRAMAYVLPYVCTAVVALVVTVIVSAPAAWGGSLQVAPVRIVLTPGRAVAAMTIGNADDAEVAVQAEVFAWSQVDGKDVYEPTRDVLVNPTIFRLAAQAQQIVRVGLRVPAGERERSYRIFLQQLPRDRAVPADGAAGGQVQTLLRIGVPIFVPPKVVRREVQWRVERGDATPVPPSTLTRNSQLPSPYRLNFRNGGDEHIQLIQVVLRHGNGDEFARKSLSHYVLAGQATALPMDLPSLPAGSPFSVEVQSDAAQPLPPAQLRMPGEAPSR